MKYALLFCLSIGLLVAPSKACAQDAATNAPTNKLYYGHISLEVVAPFGELTDNVEMGLGTGLACERVFRIFGENFGVLIGGAYVHFMDRHKEKSTNQIPVYAAFRYYPQDIHGGFYAQVQPGIHVNLTKYDVANADTETEVWFAIAPQLGYNFTERFSIGVRYQFLYAPKRDRMVISQEAGTLVPATLPKSEYYYVAAQLTYTW